MSYARARLWLGISCVGTMVVVSLLLLLFQVPRHLLFTGSAGGWAEAGQLAGVLFAYAFLSGPFDLFGGYVLPKEYGRSKARFAAFLHMWLRGVILHSLILMLVALVLLRAARAGGFPLFFGAFAALNTVLIGAQTLLASLLSGARYKSAAKETGETLAKLPGRKKPTLVLASTAAPYFTGGITGLPGLERVILPERWTQTLTPEQREAIVLRRAGVLANGSRLRGLLLALGWNMVGFCLAALLSSSVASVAGLVTCSLWFTLWNFAGLLILPPPSQRGVFSGDAFALKHGADKQTLEALIQTLDRDQDDEYARAQGVETYFHPLPSVERRIALLNTGGAQDIGAWHGARMAIYLSWAGMSFLARAVHCNCGRPDVWVFLPSD